MKVGEKGLVVESAHYGVNCGFGVVVGPCSYQERALPTELCGLPQ
jgi:hypothetical protein